MVKPIIQYIIITKNFTIVYLNLQIKYYPFMCRSMLHIGSLVRVAPYGLGLNYMDFV